MMRMTLTRRLAVMLTATSFITLGACDALTSMTGGGDAEKGGEAAAPGSFGAAPGAEGAAAPAAPALDPNLANPQIGDVWAANLDHFSAAEFNLSGGGDGDAYGLVQVVEVTDSQVTIITETGALPDQAGAIARLGDYQGSIQWDPQERIPVNRADFANLVRDQRILRTARGSGGGAATGGSNSGDYNAGAGAAPAPAAPGAAPAPAPGGGK
jgi:hypothetical protein